MGVVVAAIASVSLLITAQYVPIHPGETSDLGGGWFLFAPETDDVPCSVMKVNKAYPNFHLFGLDLNLTGEVSLLLADKNWKSIVSKKKYKVGLQFGKGQVWNETAFGISSENFGLKVEDMEPFGALKVENVSRELLREGKTHLSVSVHYRGHLISTISLIGLPYAVQKLNECRELMLSGKERPKDPFAADR